MVEYFAEVYHKSTIIFEDFWYANTTISMVDRILTFHHNYGGIWWYKATIIFLLFESLIADLCMITSTVGYNSYHMKLIRSSCQQENVFIENIIFSICDITKYFPSWLNVGLQLGLEILRYTY